jgi:DNA polymerase-1
MRVDQEEADDLMASLVCWAEPDADEVVMATCDKDLFQMVSGKTLIVGWGKDDKPAGRLEVQEKTGVLPEQIVDWLALTGDTVDNIPGVDGVGPKTATKLLAQFHSVAGIYQNIDAVKPERIREHLIADRQVVERNLALVRLNAGMECSPGWSALEYHAERSGKMRPFYAKMEFHSLLKGCEQGELF